MIPAEEIQEVLELEPWLRWYIHADDLSLDDARVRFTVCQRIAVKELRAQKETIELRVALRGLLTTAYISDRFEVES